MGLDLDPSHVPFVIQDNDDGSYFVKYKVDEPCTVNIEVFYRDEKKNLVPIRGQPFKGEF